MACECPPPGDVRFRRLAIRKPLRRSGIALGEAESQLQQLRLDTNEMLGAIDTGVATVDDAGRLVYLNDAHKAGDTVGTVRFPEADQAVNIYPIVALRNAAQPALAQKFVELVTGATGQQVLSQAGFAEPGG